MSRARTGNVRSILLSFTSLILLSSLTGEWSGARPALAMEGDSRTVVSQPNSDVGLTIDLAGFTIERDELKPNGRRYLIASRPATGLNVAITLEQVNGQASTAGCIDHLRQLQKGPAVSRGIDVALSTNHDMPTLEYTLHRFQGVRLDQKSLYACMAEAYVYANIHVSKVQYTDADAPLFQQVLQTLRLQPGQSLRITARRSNTTASEFYVKNARYEQKPEIRTLTS